jgi:hypothetical protein
MSSWSSNELVEITETILDESNLEDTDKNWELVTERVLNLGVPMSASVREFVNEYFYQLPHERKA